MKKITVTLALLTVLASLGGCASSPAGPAPNLQTSADAKVQGDVMRMIGTYEGAAGGSDRPRLVSATHVRKQGATIAEHWVVESKGKNISYQVLLRPSPRGGTDYSVARISP
jgi:hypothetical protein